MTNLISNQSWSVRRLNQIDRLTLSTTYLSDLLDGTLIYDTTELKLYIWDKINTTWVEFSELLYDDSINKLKYYNRSTGVWDTLEIDMIRYNNTTNRLELYDISTETWSSIEVDTNYEFITEQLTITGNNTCNNLSYVPYSANGVELSCNGNDLLYNNDFTISGQVITLTPIGFVITTDDILIVKYFKFLE